MLRGGIAKIKEKMDSLVDYVRRIMVFAVGLVFVILAASIIGFAVRLFNLSFISGFIAFVASIAIGTICLLKYVNEKYGSIASNESIDQD